MPSITTRHRRYATDSPLASEATARTPVAAARRRATDAAAAPPSALLTACLAAGVVTFITLLAAGEESAQHPAWTARAGPAALAPAAAAQLRRLEGSASRLAALPEAAVAVAASVVGRGQLPVALAAALAAAVAAGAAAAWALATRHAASTAAAGEVTPAPLIPWLAEAEEEEEEATTSAAASAAPSPAPAAARPTSAATPPAAAAFAGSSPPISPVDSASAWLSGLAAEARAASQSAADARDGVLAVAADLEEAFGLAAGGGAGGVRAYTPSPTTWAPARTSGAGPPPPPSAAELLRANLAAAAVATKPAPPAAKKAAGAPVPAPRSAGRVIGGAPTPAASGGWRGSSPDENADPAR